MVPAKTTNPSCSLAWAKFLASASVSKVVVSRGLRCFGRMPRLCTSTVTYQVGDIFHPCTSPVPGLEQGPAALMLGATAPKSRGDRRPQRQLSQGTMRAQDGFDFCQCVLEALWKGVHEPRLFS